MNVHTDFFSKIQVVDPERRLALPAEVDPRPEGVVPWLPGLLAPLLRQVLARTPEALLPGPLALGKAPLFEETVVLRAEPFDWVFVPIEQDPLWSGEDRFPVPRKTLRELKKVRRSGAHFDRLFVAHEIPVGSLQSGEPLPLELVQPAPPRRAVRAAERLGAIGKAAWMAGRLPSAVTTSAVQSASAAVVETIDPVIFGVRQSRELLPLGACWPDWYALCRWAW